MNDSITFPCPPTWWKYFIFLD